MKYYLQVLKKYVVFKGRASRKEFWMFVLINLLITIAFIILDNLLGTTMSNNNIYGPGANVMRGGYITNIYNLAVLLPSVAVTVRRLHDVNKTGMIFLGFLLSLVIFCFGIVFAGLAGMTWLATLMSLILLAYGIWLIVLYCTPGTPGPNKYWEDPYDDGFKFSFEEEGNTPTEE